ncbi:MAG: AbrB/MazE/SpoVT family DNA-binding domain-containing protein [Bryobacterales bacterium]|nr:AbrB/MazE/SpoVT family DNA-binding domain-containing protein [Bryobacterales bacterium]
MTITVTDDIQRMLPLRVRRQAGIKAGDQLEVRASGGIVTLMPKLPPATDEYTPEQRRIVDARLAKADKDIRMGRAYGPFNSAGEMIASMKSELKKRAAAKKPKRSR